MNMITFVLNLKPGNGRSDGIKQQQLRFRKLKSIIHAKSRAKERTLGRV